MIGNKINCEICFDKCSKDFYGENFETYLVYYEGEIEASMRKYDYACLLYISSNGIAAIIVQKGRITELVDSSPEIIRTLKEAIYTLSELSKLDDSYRTRINSIDNTGLQGKDVIVAMIDTGIDYLNKEFQYEDNTTRIISIWDQTINSGKNPENVFYGSEYTGEEINKAIKLAEAKGDAKTIVPSFDEIGHGTACAGVIGARGDNKTLKGVAKECEFIIVKLREAKDYVVDNWAVDRKNKNIYSGVDILSAIEYIMDKVSKLLKPVVIFIPLGSNCGSHDGTGPIDVVIDRYSLNRGVVFVSGLGNEGIGETHTSGDFTRKDEIKTIALRIDKNQKDIFVQIWFKKPDKASIEIVSPNGETSGRIPSKIEGSEEVSFIFEGTSGIVSYEMSEVNSGDQLIEVELRQLVPGAWLLQLRGDYIVDGRFDAWLMQKELLEKETKFLRPDTMITLTRISDCRNIVCCSYYNQNNNSIVEESGKGYTRDGRIKPDVACPGVNVVTTAVGGGTISVTGSSMAAASLAGIVTLILQWGIVQRKAPKMSAITVKDYLIRATKKKPGEIYPNPELGYGFLDMDEVFKLTRENLRHKKLILVNIPMEIIALLKK